MSDLKFTTAGEYMRTQPEYIIKQLEAHNSRLDKESILDSAMKEGLDEFFEGVQYALDSLITFGVKQVPEATEDGQGLEWHVFKELATKLANRDLTGHAARDAIELVKNVATVDQWNTFYRRILIKDLRCGVSEKTVNKVAKKYPQYSVPIFSCQLAHDSAKHEKKVKGKKLIEVKLDGVRVITIVHPNGTVNLYSRNGKPLTNFSRITDWFSTNVAPTLDTAMVFDGEVMSGTFQDLMKQVHRKSDAQTDDAVLHLFDVLELSEFKRGFTVGKPQVVRSKLLADIADTFHGDIIRVVPQELVDLDTPEGVQRVNELDQAAIDSGYEGIMIKDPDAEYECKRTASWLKLKPFIEVTLTIVDVEEGTGKNAGMLGAFVLEGIDDGRKIRVNCGSGFSDKQRQQYWDFKSLCMHKLAEIRADAITQNQDGTYSLRFPRFKTFRGFELGEKI